MNYIENYFSKINIADLELNDIESFFQTEKEESDKIEFKSFYSDNNNVSEKESALIKSICAFLNSEGGIIIWGAPIGKKVEGKKEKVFIGELSPVEKLYERDEIINKITNLITPQPIGVQFHRIELNSKYIYIFHTQKSPYSPHQYKDRYYMRLDGHTRTAPHHYIEAQFKRITYPNINGYIKFENIIDPEDGTKILNIIIYFFNLSKLQNDYDLRYRLLVNKGSIDYLNPQRPLENYKYLNYNHELERTNVKDVIYFGEPVFEPRKIIFQNFDNLSEFEFEALLFWGTKLSPMKISQYSLQIDMLHDTINKIEIIHENIMMHEFTEDRNDTNSTIKKILGR